MTLSRRPRSCLQFSSVHYNQHNSTCSFTCFYSWQCQLTWISDKSMTSARDRHTPLCARRVTNSRDRLTTYNQHAQAEWSTVQSCSQLFVFLLLKLSVSRGEESLSKLFEKLKIFANFFWKQKSGRPGGRQYHCPCLKAKLTTLWT